MVSDQIACAHKMPFLHKKSIDQQNFKMQDHIPDALNNPKTYQQTNSVIITTKIENYHARKSFPDLQL